jgi:hypothetical protein
MIVRRHLGTLLFLSILLIERVAAFFPQSLDGILSPFTLAVIYVRSYIFCYLLCPVGYYAGHACPSSLFDVPSWPAWIIATSTILAVTLTVEYLLFRLASQRPVIITEQNL